MIDTITVVVMDRLLQRGFTVQFALETDVDESARITYPVQFWRVSEENQIKSIWKLNHIFVA